MSNPPRCRLPAQLASGSAAAHARIARLAAHLVQPLRHFFGQPRQVALRSDRDPPRVRSPEIRLGEAGSCGACGARPANSVNCVAGEEAQIEPAEDVVHQALGVADLLVARPARGLKAGVRKLLAQHAQRHAVLQGQRNRGGKGIHQAGDGRSFLGHLDEDFAGLTGRDRDPP